MKQGALIFDKQANRYDIRSDLADYYGELHYGEAFDVMVRQVEAIDRLIKEDGARHEAGDFKSGGKGSHVDGANSVYSGSRAFALDGKGWIHFPARWKGSCFQKIGDAANRRK